MRGMRKVAIIVAVLLVVAVVAVVALLPTLVDVNRYHGQIQAELEERLNRPVSLGRMHLRVFPFSIRVQNPVIGEDPAFNTGRAFAQAEELQIRTALLPLLLRRQVEIRSLELSRPHLELVRSARGEWNFATLGPAQKPRGARTEQEDETGTPAARHDFTLSYLHISGGQVAVTDFQQRRPRQVYDNIFLTLRDYAPDRSFRLEMAAHLPGTGNQRVEFAGEAGPLNQQALAATPFEGRLSLERVSLEGLNQFLAADALRQYGGVLTGQVELRNQQDEFAASGEVSLEQGRVRNAHLGYPVELNFRVSGNLQTDQYRIEQTQIRLGQTPLEVSGSIDGSGETPMLDLHLRSGDVSIAEVARLAGAFGMAFNPNMQVTGRMNADVRVRGPANAPRFEGQVQGSQVEMTSRETKQSVRVPSLALALRQDAIQSNEFTATSGNTSLRSQFTLANYAGPGARIDATVRAANADLRETLHIAQAWGVTAAEGMEGSGALSLDLRLQGPTRDPAQWRYSGSGRLTNATLRTQNLRQPLQVNNAELRFTAETINLENVAARLGHTNFGGRVAVRNLARPNVQFALQADQFDVQEWQDLVIVQPAEKPEDAQRENILLRTTGGGSINVGTLRYDQLVVTEATAQVALNNGVVRMDPVRGRLFGGTHVGSVTADLRSNPTLYRLSSRTAQLDANQFLSAVSDLDNKIFGVLATQIDATFLAGESAAIARTLNGNLRLELLNGRVANVDLTRELAVIGRFTGAPAQQAEPFTRVTRMGGSFNVQNGVARTDNLQAEFEGGTIASSGTIDLVRQTLNMQATAVLTREYSERMGGTQIGGFMHTALANRHGELVLPVLITGSLTQPSFAPDMQRIARMQAENLLPTASDPGRLTSTILGAIGGNGRPARGGLGGIVDAITGRPQQPQQTPDGVAGPADPQADPQAQPQPPPAQQPQAQPNPNDPFGAAAGALIDQLRKRQQKPQQQPPPPQEEPPPRT